MPQADIVGAAFGALAPHLWTAAIFAVVAVGASLAGLYGILRGIDVVLGMLSLDTLTGLRHRLEESEHADWIEARELREEREEIWDRIQSERAADADIFISPADMHFPGDGDDDDDEFAEDGRYRE